MAGKILLVDDDRGYLLAVRRMLEGAGHTVRVASSAVEARRALEAELPDLILLDVIMPGEDGLTLADDLGKSGKAVGVPVILVTAVAEMPGDMLGVFEKDKGLTAVDILPKSAVAEQLLDTVTAALGAGRAGCSGRCGGCGG